MPTDTSEKAYQNDIIAELVASGYKKRGTETYHKDVGLDIELVLKFIAESQSKLWQRWQKHYGERSETKFLNRLTKELNKKGAIHVIREGLKDTGCHFRLFYPEPHNNKNPDHQLLYEKNIYSVIDELEYENREKGNRLDLVIFVNGLPVITIELKDTFSQGVEKAISQYKKDRNPKELIFHRALVHFAMSDEKIYYATKLASEKTWFLPFNKGIENPDVEEGYKTNYIIEEVLIPERLAKLMSHYVFAEVDEDDKSEAIIFPRYHQIQCTRQLLDIAKPGTNYLIQHSAGSGKTKTIAWLAHGLIKKFDNADERVYDTVVVISDRKVIDRQLQNQIKAVEKTKGVVEKIDKDSQQLKEALKDSRNIIVTTIQKFPFVLKEIDDLGDKKYAVIVDEAHSSQSGITARSLRQVLLPTAVTEVEEGEYDLEDMTEADRKMLHELRRFNNQNNISFFGFTATPKQKTLEMFGLKDKEGHYVPFHLYSMKQAIKEGFILDVLENYLSYESYFKLMKKIKDDPDYEEKKTKALLRNFVEKQPEVIERKARIMLDHFMNSTKHKLHDKAKAMVVTKSRLHAVRYKRAFDKLGKESGLDFKILVAFSGTVKDKAVAKEYTENSMNNLPPRVSIRKAFDKDEYRILIVANKFQTGFDQPLLHTMYVDKKLNGITAVQTLSRANRIAPFVGKRDTLILDFVNSTDVIQKSFQPYYGQTYLNEGTDHHKLYELYDKLLDFQIFDEAEVNQFVKLFNNKAHQTKLHLIINQAVAEFKKQIKNDQVVFKKALRRYQSMYSFLSQLIPFADVRLEKLYIYNKYLIKKLPTINDPLPYHVLQDVDLDSYAVRSKGMRKIKLNEEGKLKGVDDDVTTVIEDGKTKLSKIVKDLNDAFGTEFTENDKVFLGRIKDSLLRNKDLKEKIKRNSKQNVEAVFDKYFNEEMSDLLNDDMKLYKKINDNKALQDKIRKALFNLVYSEEKKRK